MPGTGLTAGALCIAFAVGFGAAWTAQGWRWDAADAKVESAELRAAKGALERSQENERKAREDSEATRRELANYKKEALNEIDNLEQRVIDGPERVYVKASCPKPVPGAATDASGIGTGTAELASSTAKDLFNFERAYVEQFVKFQQCWRELKSRSSK